MSLSWRQYPLINIKICNLSKDVVAGKKLATVGSGRLVFINKSHHLGVFDQCCQDLWGLKRSIDGDFSQGFDGLIWGIRYFLCEFCPLYLDVAIILQQ